MKAKPPRSPARTPAARPGDANPGRSSERTPRPESGQEGPARPPKPTATVAGRNPVSRAKPRANTFQRASYLLSAHNQRQLPVDAGREVAFAGRSNAGKSSALNAICGQNALARVSKTPGRTQQLVYFALPPHAEVHLVDLPGYGYAKVPKEMQEHWQAFIADYFETRQALAGLVVVMDIRHPLKDYDLQMLGYAVQRGIPAHALLTKADKLPRGAAGNTLQAVRRELQQRFGDTVSAQVFSGESKQGVEEARAVLSRWLHLPAA